MLPCVSFIYPHTISLQTESPSWVVGLCDCKSEPKTEFCPVTRVTACQRKEMEPWKRYTHVRFQIKAPLSFLEDVLYSKVDVCRGWGGGAVFWIWAQLFLNLVTHVWFIRCVFRLLSLSLPAAEKGVAESLPLQMKSNSDHQSWGNGRALFFPFPFFFF